MSLHNYSYNEQTQLNETLQRELLDMLARDQEARKALAVKYRPGNWRT